MASSVRARRLRFSALLAAGAAPVALAALAPTSAPAQPRKLAKPAVSAFDRNVGTFMDKYCVSCHNDSARAGGLTLTAFRNAGSVARDPKTWEHVIEKLHTGQMPPQGSPRPSAIRTEFVVADIQDEIARVERLQKPDPGRVTARRLNRAEYDNTIRDLLGVDFHPADDFPQDDSGYGFDNIGDVLSLSPSLMEKYLAAAEKIARAAVYGPAEMKPSLAELRTGRVNIPPLTAVPVGYDATGLSLPNAAHRMYRFPADADYEIAGVLTGQRPGSAEAMHIALWIDGVKVQELEHDATAMASFDADPKDLYGQTAHFKRTHVSAGEHWVAVSLVKMFEGMPPRYNGPNPSKRPDIELKPFGRPLPADATPEQREQFAKRQEQFKKRFEEMKASQARQPINAARIGAMEIRGPYDQAKGPTSASRRILTACGYADNNKTPEAARKIVANIARRAFRRPVTAAEVERYVGLIADAQAAGDSFDEGLCVAIQAILVSPHFLFRIESGGAPDKDGIAHLRDHELASRLSYFLWSSMPDDELRQCADTGALRRPAVLDAQVKRMLADPRSSALASNFAGQWLELRKLESVKPDVDKFPAFDDYLRLSMRRETELFFNHIVRNDCSIVDFLNGKYTYVNDRLAAFYGIPGVHGPEFRQVDLSGTNRGGILTQASVLTVSSYATRTSPVLRGKWILDNIFNTPPPPPPPNVPALEATRIASGMSLRQQLETHRSNPLCASCHSRLDPLGFALENFDAIGGWRTKDGAAPIDATGTLPDGRSFTGPVALRATLTADKAAFTRCMTEKMLTYALGRGLERYDKPTVNDIAARVAKDDYRFSSLVRSIVTSLPFEQRRGTTHP